MLLNAIIEKDEYGYFAYIPAFEGCVSQGESYEEAIKNINEAAELYIQSLTKDEIDLIMAKNTAIVPLQVALNATIS